MGENVANLYWCWSSQILQRPTVFLWLVQELNNHSNWEEINTALQILNPQRVVGPSLLTACFCVLPSRAKAGNKCFILYLMLTFLHSEMNNHYLWERSVPQQLKCLQWKNASPPENSEGCHVDVTENCERAIKLKTNSYWWNWYCTNKWNLFVLTEFVVPLLTAASVILSSVYKERKKKKKTLWHLLKL